MRTVDWTKVSDYDKSSVCNSLKVTEYDKWHLKVAKGYSGWNMATKANNIKHVNNNSMFLKFRKTKF